MQVIARQTVEAASDGSLKFSVVDPVMAGGSISPTGDKAKWVPIKPATDGAFVMAMMRWMFENKSFDEMFLSAPSLPAARSLGYNSWTNAAHLVIVEPGHPNERKMLRPEDLGITAPEIQVDPKKKVPDGMDEYFIVINKETGKPALHTEVKQSDLYFNGTVVDSTGKAIKVRTSFDILKESAFEFDMETYSKACGIPVDTIIEIARDFSSNGYKVGVDGMGGTATSNGVHMTFAMYILPALMGAINKKGGLMQRRVSFASFSDGPRYDLKNIEGATKAKGFLLSRTGVRYEETTEYKNKVAQGINPYPSKLPWHPVGNASDNQAIFSIINQYPYQTKVMMNWMFNPLLSSPSAARKEVIEKLSDPSVLPLYISMDAFMGESTYLADYIIPDTTQFEFWGVGVSEGQIPTKVSKICWPVVEPMTMKLSDGRHACFENYLIDICKEIGVPGFGEKALKDKDGSYHPINHPEDYFLRAIANTAFDLEPVPDISAHEIELQGLQPELDKWKASIKPEELSKVAYLIARGGRFEKAGQGYVGDGTDLKYAYEGVIRFYMEDVATSIDSFTGKFYEGVPGWYPETFADGTLLTDNYPESKWPFTGANYKAKFRSITMLANNKHLQELGKTNYIEINTEEAKKLGLKTGDKVKLIAATGGEVTGELLARPGVAKGTVAVEFGYGHWEYGARKHKVGNKTIGGDKAIGTGVNLTEISLMDPTVPAPFALSEMMTGGPSRNGGAYRIEKA